MSWVVIGYPNVSCRADEQANTVVEGPPSLDSDEVYAITDEWASSVAWAPNLVLLDYVTII
jgi:hypothetical protein